MPETKCLAKSKVLFSPLQKKFAFPVLNQWVSKFNAPKKHLNSLLSISWALLSQIMVQKVGMGSMNFHF